MPTICFDHARVSFISVVWVALSTLVHQEHDCSARVQRPVGVIFPGCCVFLFEEIAL